MRSQWSKTHCGNAVPLARAGKEEGRPRDSAAGRCALTRTRGVPSQGISSKTRPRRSPTQSRTPLAASCGQRTSTKSTGSCSVGLPAISAARQLRRTGGMICPAPRWMASACSRTSRMLKRMPRMLSSHNGPSLAALWKPPSTCPLISSRWRPLAAAVASTTTLAPSISGPQHQILRAWSSRQRNLSRRVSSRSRASARGPSLPLSISLLSSSGIGSALRLMRLWPFGDVTRQLSEDRSVTVSR
mmetsp:Transcript_112222/g.349703  ORF Transcript_112222/g.349703 Transcript_112222/m.349703 type:complete len:244 (+) Transcript_112222:274-1005(+)